MAELIPLEYRIALVRRRFIERWAIVAGLALAVSVAALANEFARSRRETVALDKANETYNSKSLLIARAKEVQSRRTDLASRMHKIQELMDDKVLLSLLRSVSSSFSPSDCLDYIKIDAHRTPNAAAKIVDDGKYSVKFVGLTANDTTHADLLTRLADIGAKADPPIMITPESLRRENMYDGQVMKLQVTCDPPAVKGG